MSKNLLTSFLLLLFFADSTSQVKTTILDRDARYELVFSDEFNQRNGSEPDTTIWSRKPRNQDCCNRWNSHSSKVVFIKNGSLVCRAVPNKYEPEDTARMLTGSIWTFGKFNVKYGKIEVRMRTNLSKRHLM